MAITQVVYTPTDGLKNTTSFPNNPGSNANARKQFQDVFDQIKNAVNLIVTELEAGGLNTIYYTETEVDALISVLATAASVTTVANNLTTHKTSSDHDGRYYTEAEVDAIASAIVVGGLAPNSITNTYLASDVKVGSLAALTTTDKTSVTAAINEVDSHADSAQSTATAAMPKAGGTFTGETLHGRQLVTQPKLKDYSENLTTNATATGTVSLDLTTANVFNETLTGNTVFTFDNPATTGQAHSFTVFLNQGGTAYTVTWPASVKWSNDSIPVISDINKTCVISFVSLNGGTRWYGSAITKLTT